MPSATSPPPSVHQDIPSFLSPQTFDIIPDIYTLISRLQPTITSPGAANLLNSRLQDTTAPSLGPPLELKELTHAIHPIKLKIQKARANVTALPDVEHTVEEQYEELRELEDRVRALRRRLSELGRRAGEKDKSDFDRHQVMEGSQSQ